MSVKITYRFHCDGCNRPSKPGMADARKLDRSQTEDLLHELRKEGWKRMRPACKDGHGEYCPTCVEAIEEARDRAAAARKKAPDGTGQTHAGITPRQAIRALRGPGRLRADQAPRPRGVQGEEAGRMRGESRTGRDPGGGEP